MKLSLGMETPKADPMHIAVVMACHNRRSHTIACLQSLRAQSALTPPSACKLTLWVLDDASTDGTAEAIMEAWPEANIITGDGQHYWCGGMRAAWSRAATSDPDYYLLVNDDTTIVPDALVELLALAPSPQALTIAVAAIADPRSGKVVFGGHKGHNLAPVQPAGKPEECDTMNANCTLIPRAVHHMLGGLHTAYTHSMGDFDYGFQATRRGIKVLQSSRILGFSMQNSEEGTWRDRTLPRFRRIALLWNSPTRGLPFREWCAYCIRNHGIHAVYKFISPTMRVILGR